MESACSRMVICGSFSDVSYPKNIFGMAEITNIGITMMAMRTPTANLMIVGKSSFAAAAAAP